MSGALCPLCETQSGTLLSTKDRHNKALETCCCTACGLVFNNPIPDEAALRAFYRTDYRQDYKNTAQPKLKHHYRYGGRVAEQISSYPEPYRKAQRVLDIGSGSGEFVALMLALGREVQGVEPTESYAAYVTETFGANIFNGSVDDFQAEGRYDLIRLNHVLEHLADPVERLSLIRDLLNEDGVLHVEVPDFRTYCRTKSSGNMFHFGHIFNYDAHTLQSVAARAGLEAIHSSGPTSIYFKACTPFTIPADAENAALNQDYYTKHMSGTFRGPLSGIGRLVSKLGSARAEKQAVARLKDAKGIIAHYADELKAVLSS